MSKSLNLSPQIGMAEADLKILFKQIRDWADKPPPGSSGICFVVDIGLLGGGYASISFTKNEVDAQDDWQLRNLIKNRVENA